MVGINDSKCVLVIGATSGIGRALALAIHALESKPIVIVAGRRQARLDEIATDNDKDYRLKSACVDISAGKDALKKFVESILGEYPKLDTVVFAAGIQRSFNFAKVDDIVLDDIYDEFNVNYLSITVLIYHFLPHLRKLAAEGQPCFLVPISSSLAMIPATHVANYCATKAALHSLSISLHNSLQGTNVHVMEILPPINRLVESELHDQQGTTEYLSKRWMPLKEFTKHAMEGLGRGDLNIVVPDTRIYWEKVEKERIEISKENAKRIRRILEV